MITLSKLRINLSPNISVYIPPLTFQKGKIYLLLGDSGCGKTSFLKALAGFIPKNHLEGTLPTFQTALLLQNPMHQMIMSTVESELKFPLIQYGFSDNDVEKKSTKIAEFFRLDSLLKSKLYDLSFGELQTVMLAATLLIPADLILLDEPTSHLDYPMIEKMYSWIHQYGNDSAFLVASQFPDEYRFVDTVLHFMGHQLKYMLDTNNYPQFIQENHDISRLEAETIQKYLNAINK